MEINKIQEQTIKAFEDNADLFKALKDLREVGSDKKYLDNSQKLFEVVNLLCTKSKRLMLNDYTDGGTKFGINKNGLGTMRNYNCQLEQLNGSWGIKSMRKMLLRLLKDEVGFENLKNLINKNSVKDLKKIRTYFKNLKEETQQTDDKRFNINITIGNEIFTISISYIDGEVQDVYFQKDGGNISHSFQDREILGILNRDKTLIYSNENINALKNIGEQRIDLSLETLKHIEFIFQNKREIKKQISQSINKMKKENKQGQREEVFLSSILNPLKAVDNL